MVPLAALQDVRGELKETKALLMQQMQMQQARPEQAPQPAPDFYEDPQGAMQSQIAPVQQALEAEKLKMSRFYAEDKFGREEVEAAFEYFNQNPEQSKALLNHPSPFHAAVEVYQKQKAMAEIGNDPQAYKARVEAEIRAKVEAEFKANQVAENVTQVPAAPGSLASEPNLGTRKAPEWAGPSSLDDILSG